jgi:site-specific recombinase
MKPNKLVFLFSKFKRVAAGSRSRGGLTDLLDQSGSFSDLHERMYWFEQILLWLRKGNSEAGEVRLRYFFQVLEQNPKWKIAFRNNLSELINGCSFLNFFSYTGYTTEHGLWTDISSRIFERLMPNPGEGDFQEIIRNVFENEHNIEWLINISDGNLTLIKDLTTFEKGQSIGFAFQKDIQEALIILSVHVAHHSLAIDIRKRLDEDTSVKDSPFFSLATLIQKTALDSKDPNTGGPVQSLLAKCRSDIDLVYEKMENTGVSVSVVHKLEVLSALIEQIELLLKFEFEEIDLKKTKEFRDYIVAVARAGVRGRSIREHIKRHFYLLSRKIAERNGHSGEHYISRTPGEVRTLFKSAIGGGFIVVGMIICKTLLIRTEPAPFFLALGIWFIYSTGFLSMQFMGATLATKIPSFTASHLARKLKESRTELGQDDLGAEIRVIVKSQIVALFGNFIGVIPLALGVGLLSHYLFQDHQLMSEHYARHTLGDLNPVFSMAIFLGALTGVELWASSICGGWFENWIVFTAFGERISKHSRMKKVFGETLTQRFADKLIKHSSGIGTNVSLGFFFGFVPLVGSMFGLNLDGKHVTISTAGASFAISALHYDIPAREWIYTISGLFLIGTMNFLTSFTLALSVAARAQKMKVRWVWHYLRRGIKDPPQRKSHINIADAGVE